MILGWFLFSVGLGCDSRAPGAATQGSDLHKLVPGIHVDCLRSFGWEEIGDSSRTLTEEERKSGGGVLGIVIAISEGPDGSLYVLDRQFHKVVRFSEDGEFAELVVAGFGQGPGEFLRPGGLAVSDAIEILVVDRGLGRLSVFDRRGELLRSIPLPRPQVLDIAQSPRGVFLRVWSRSVGSVQVLRINEVRGEILGELLVASQRDAHFGSFGESGAIGIDPAGNAVYAHPSPGLWTVLGGPDAGLRGEELFPRARGVTLPRPNGAEARASPVGTRGIAVWEDGRVAILHFHREWTDARRAELTDHQFFLGIFDSLGRYQGSVEVPGSFVTGFEAGRTPGVFYLAYHEPYPHVAKCQFRLLSGGGERW